MITEAKEKREIPGIKGCIDNSLWLATDSILVYEFSDIEIHEQFLTGTLYVGVRKWAFEIALDQPHTEHTDRFVIGAKLFQIIDANTLLVTTQDQQTDLIFLKRL